MALLFMLAIFLFLFLGFQIFLALAIPSMFFLVEVLDREMWMAPQRFVGGINSFTLLCVPFFILAASIMGKGRIGGKLLKLSRSIVGHFHGGVAFTGIVACTIVGAISGIGTAGILTIGPLISKEMEEFGYSKGFAAGLITSVSSVAMLIPPSVIIVIYAVNTGTSIARLFLGGIGAGVTFSAVFMVYSYIYARRNELPLSKRPSLKEFLEGLKESIWALGLPIIILGGMYSGIFSPTEAAGVAAVYAIFVEVVVYRDMSLKEVFQTAIEAGSKVAMIYMLLGAGNLLAYVMTIARIPQLLEGLFAEVGSMLVLLSINIAFLIAGMFVGPGSAIVILIPLFYPVAQAAGINPLHLGIVIVTNLAIGMYTPPFGLNLFVSSGVLDLKISYLMKSMVPFILLSFVVLLLVTLFPAISLWLPDVLMN